jgi:dTDP-4-dehydrorhamnose 3,5-epimerase
VHIRHGDYLLMVEGQATIGLRDLRPGSPTENAVGVVDLKASEPAAIVIPPGVAHGFLFHAPSIHVYAVTHYWDPADEIGCHWADPALGIPWPIAPGSAGDIRVSSRDAALRPLSDLAGRIPRWSET